MAYTTDELYRMEKSFVREGPYTNEISFPLGGIGSGCIGLAGNGRLIDWEIFNRPNKNSYNGFSFFAVKAEHKGNLRTAKVLTGDLHPPYTGGANGKFCGFGFGPRRESMAGLPHFKSTRFKGEFPLAEVEFLDDEAPIEANLVAYNPFIPLNDKDSSLPAAILTYRITNRSEEQLDVTVAGNLTNPVKKGPVNRSEDFGGFKGIRLYTDLISKDHSDFGDMTLSTDCNQVSYQSYWYRGGWFDNLTVFWKDFCSPGKFRDRTYKPQSEGGVSHDAQDVGLLASHISLEPGETGDFRFMITWNFPNFINFWNPGQCGVREDGTPDYPSWQNYYATLFKDSAETAAYIWKHAQRLYKETSIFKETLFRTSLPDYVVEAVASPLSVLKSATCLRLTDGTLYGFEGVHGDEGSCEGSCTHVWNYEQATAFLFPALARGMREVDYNYALHANGKMTFRLMLPVERTLSDNPPRAAVDDKSNPHRAAVDGQMGGIIKVYREWKVSGDTEWLKKMWPMVKKSLEYAWHPTNEDLWDADKDGVMEGRQHHTLDMELFGPNSWLTGYYLTALKTAAEMASHLGETDKAAEFEAIFGQGRTYLNEHLFNGEYFHQRVNLKDKSILEKFGADEVYWNEEAQEMKYQIAEGCAIDQVIGQWFAHVVGAGYIFDRDKVRTALRNLFKNNFVENFRNHVNTCRIYAVNDDKGLVIATWPGTNSPNIPVTYQDETMHGFEYQAGSHMLYEGHLDEGLSVIKAIRDRYDGLSRNPWNEMECGSNYARSMASYSLLHALGGFEYDMVRGLVGFSPKLNQNHYRSFWSLSSGWGEFIHEAGVIRLTILSGTLALRRFRSELLDGARVEELRAAGSDVDYRREGNELVFGADIVIGSDQCLELKVER